MSLGRSKPMNPNEVPLTVLSDLIGACPGPAFARLPLLSHSWPPSLSFSFSLLLYLWRFTSTVNSGVSCHPFSQSRSLLPYRGRATLQWCLTPPSGWCSCGLWHLRWWRNQLPCCILSPVLWLCSEFCFVFNEHSFLIIWWQPLSSFGLKTKPPFENVLCVGIYKILQKKSDRHHDIPQTPTVLGQATITWSHRMSGLNDRILFSHCFGGWKSAVMVPA